MYMTGNDTVNMEITIFLSRLGNIEVCIGIPLFDVCPLVCLNGSHNFLGSFFD